MIAHMQPVKLIAPNGISAIDTITEHGTAK